MTDPVTATRRFGYGARPGELDRYRGRARQRLLEEIDRPGIALLDDHGLPSSAEIGETMGGYIAKVRALKLKYKRRKKGLVDPAGETMADGNMAGGTTENPDAAFRRLRKALGRKPSRLIHEREVEARIERLRTTSTAFVERWVSFWSGHFAVSARKNGYLRGFVGAFEREAIRPNAFAKFEDLLVASTSHPAMLIYLDNIRSTGPNSPKGLERGRGLNENLAREVLELHTLGVDGGYSQADVTALARALTGWSMAGRRSDTPGLFRFRPDAHEPGTVTIMGVEYPQPDMAQARQVLGDLARHPATARHLATRIARHFISENPPPALVGRLSKSFAETGGDLRALARTLIEAEESWSEPARKVLPPYDLVINCARALGWVPRPRQVRRMLRTFGQLPMMPPLPAGWPDGDEIWAASDALLERLDWTDQLVARVRPAGDPIARAEAVLGGRLSETTRTAMARAESPRQAFVLFLMSPEFQRR